LSSRLESVGETDPDVAFAEIHLAAVYKALGDCDAAYASGNRAVNIFSATEELRQIYADELGKALSNLGGISLDCSSDTIRARELYQEALNMHEQLYGRNHITVATDLNNLGAVDRAERNWGAALEKFRSAVNIHRQVISVNDRRLATGLYNVGTAAFNVGRYDEARVALTEAVDILDKTRVAEIDGELIGPLEGLAQTLLFLGRPSEAIEKFDRVIPIAEGVHGRDSEVVERIKAERGTAAYATIRNLVT
jgi:tetratricopeptide (TPR) repeat protein